MGSWSIFHWLVVLVVVILVFGTGKLKKAGRDLGVALRGFKGGFKDGIKEGEEDKEVEAIEDSNGVLYEQQSGEQFNEEERVKEEVKQEENKA